VSRMRPAGLAAAAVLLAAVVLAAVVLVAVVLVMGKTVRRCRIGAGT